MRNVFSLSEKFSKCLFGSQWTRIPSTTFARNVRGKKKISSSINARTTIRSSLDAVIYSMCLFRLKNFWTVFSESINSSGAYTIRAYGPGRKNLLLEFYRRYDYHSKFFTKSKKCALTNCSLVWCAILFLCIKKFWNVCPEFNDLKWAVHISAYASWKKNLQFYWCYNNHSKLFWKLKTYSLTWCNLFLCAMVFFAVKNFLSVSPNELTLFALSHSFYLAGKKN